MKKTITGFLLFLLSTVILCITAAASPVPETIRIGLCYGDGAAEQIEISSTYGLYIEIGESKLQLLQQATVSPREGGGLIINGMEFAEQTIDIYANSGGDFVYKKIRYRGIARFIATEQGVTLVNIVDPEEYLYSVVGRESSNYFPIEALKAQAVCARNYLVRNIGRHEDAGFDICTTTHCQVYGGIASEGDKTIEAVEQTRGVLMTYDGEICEGYYFATDGGATENSENVWVAEIPYLVGVIDPYENPDEATYYNWEETISAEQIKQSLASRDIDIGDITDVSVTEYSEKGRAIELTITGTEGTKKYYKDNIRAAFGSEISLKSTRFTIKKPSAPMPTVSVKTGSGIKTRTVPNGTKVMTANGIIVLEEQIKDNNNNYVFTGQGWGHGVGMSQWGAKGMAEAGKTYDEILKFYYTGVEVSQVDA